MRKTVPRPRTALAALAAAALITTVLAGGAHPPAAAAADNACSNPILADNLNGWGSTDGAAVSRDQVGDLAGVNWAFDTSGHEFYMPEVAVSPGQTWTFAARDRVVFGSGSAEMTVQWYSAGGAYLGDVTGSPVNLPAASTTGGDPWYLVSVTATVPAGAARAHVLQTGTFSPASGTDFKATACDYRLGGSTPPGDPTSAADRYGWGAINPALSDEYNGTAVDLSKWTPMGAATGQNTGCWPGHTGNGQRCASQATVGGGYLSVTGTANGVTGGLSGEGTPWRYGRVEVRERAVALPGTGAAYHPVSLLWPAEPQNYKDGEIDFAERNIGDTAVQLFVHHDNGPQENCSKTVDSTQFHNYAVDWQPNSVRWYVDGDLVCTVNVAVSTYSKTNGGAQLDMLDATGTPMRPAREDVDWIRVYPTSQTQYQ